MYLDHLIARFNNHLFNFGITDINIIIQLSLSNINLFRIKQSCGFYYHRL